MYLVTFVVVLYFHDAACLLWPKGIVHYTFNKKDYDIHSQDEISSTFAQLQNEICVKFFNTPMNYSANVRDKILYISNPEKRKTCSPDQYDYSKTVVDMVIGYKCINQKDITRIVVDMLRASIEQTVATVNSYDLIRKFQEQDEDPSRPSLLSPVDRNYLNAHYHTECGALSLPATAETRRFSGGNLQLSDENEEYYKDKLWPLGIVLYGVDPRVRDSPSFPILKYAMTTIELATCVVFQKVDNDAVLAPKSVIWFSFEGEDMPALGFREGNQTISLESMTTGAPGHSAHTLNMVLRILGVPMMSNRFDRDNYVAVHWKNIEKGKEVYLEKTPDSAWVSQKEGQKVAYDFNSASHAAANYMCRDCSLGSQTVLPLQDHLWQRTLSMGHVTDLSAGDVELLQVLYSRNCLNRFISNK